MCVYMYICIYVYTMLPRLSPFGSPAVPARPKKKSSIGLGVRHLRAGKKTLHRFRGCTFTVGTKQKTRKKKNKKTKTKNRNQPKKNQFTFKKHKKKQL